MKKNAKHWLTICTMDGKECRDFPAKQVADSTGYDLRTVIRWCEGHPIPAPARLLLSVVMLGTLPGKSWRRWRLLGDVLTDTDTGQQYAPQDVGAAWILGQQLAESLRETEHAKRETEALRLQLARIADRRACLTSWHQRAPAKPRQFDLLSSSQIQKIPS